MVSNQFCFQIEFEIIFLGNSVKMRLICLLGAVSVGFGSGMKPDATEGAAAIEVDAGSHPVDVSVEPHGSPGVPAAKPPSTEKKDFSITTATFATSSIATEEKIFFTNFHNAAQELSLLGIKAVGLATQIQAIRGHMMMLQLIDDHIETLTKDEVKYSDLLKKAHEELRSVVGRPGKGEV